VLGVCAGDARDAAARGESERASASTHRRGFFQVTGCLSTMTVGYATGGKLVLMPAGRFDPSPRAGASARSDAIGGVPTIHVARIHRGAGAPSSRKTCRQVDSRREIRSRATTEHALVGAHSRSVPETWQDAHNAYGLTETASVATDTGATTTRATRIGRPRGPTSS